MPSVTAFDVFVEEIFRAEGGRAPREQEKREGGRTIYGIFEKAHPEAFKNGLPTKEEARRIYREHYWNKIKGDWINNISPELALVMFDIAVNSGPSAAICMLQRLVGVKDDGIIGPVTLKAVKLFLADKMIESQRNHYAKLIHMNPSKFGPNERGWENRMRNLEAKIRKM